MRAIQEAIKYCWNQNTGKVKVKSNSLLMVKVIVEFGKFLGGGRATRGHKKS